MPKLRVAKIKGFTVHLWPWHQSRASNRSVDFGVEVATGLLPGSCCGTLGRSCTSNTKHSNMEHTHNNTTMTVRHTTQKVGKKWTKVCNCSCIWW